MKNFQKNIFFYFSVALITFTACFLSNLDKERHIERTNFLSQSSPKYIPHNKILLNINNISLEELTQIKGIGEKTAKKIHEFRQQKGKIKSIDELLEVKGIGKKKLEKLKQVLTVSNAK